MQLGLLVGIALDKGETYDEPVYLGQAAALWSLGDPGDVPPLPKWVWAVGVRTLDPGIDGQIQIATAYPYRDHASYYLAKAPDLRHRLLFRARLGTILAVVLGGLCLWRAARRFGDGVGFVAHALWVVSPGILASGCLVTLDAWSAAGVAGALLATLRAIEKPSVARTVVLGVVLGLALSTKAHVIVAVPFALAALAWGVGRRHALKHVAIAAIVTPLALWATYGFAVQEVAPTIMVDARPYGIGRIPLGSWITVLLDKVLTPPGPLIPGVNYFMGHSRFDGSPWFHLTGLLLKTTIGAQLLIAVRVLRRRGLAVDAALLAFPVVLIALMSVSDNQPSLMYVLPVWPLGIVVAARAVGDLVAWVGAKRGAIAAGVMLGLSAGETMSVYPHELMFFNLWAGGPAGGYRYFINREDWGQDKRLVGVWQKEHGLATIYYSGHGRGDDGWGIVAEPLPCGPHVGVFAIHAAFLHMQKHPLWGWPEPGCLDWLTIEPPDERLGWSIYIYRVDEARIARLADEARAGKPPWWKNPRDLELEKMLGR